MAIGPQALSANTIIGDSVVNEYGEDLGKDDYGYDPYWE